MPESRVAFDTLESGTVIVSNPARGAWGERLAWRLTDEMRIGTRHGEGPTVFGDVRDVALDQLGRLYVLDVQAQHIRLFDTDGSYVRTFGRRGRGPGEFRSAVGMLFDPTGRLWVLNEGNQRYSVFDTNGVLLTEFPRRGNMEFGVWSRGVFTPEGDLYDLVPRTPSGRHLRYGRYDTARGDFADTTLRSPPLPVGTPLGWGYSLPTPGGWWMGVASEYRLWQMTRTEDTIRIVRRVHPFNPLTVEQRDSIRRLKRDLQERARRPQAFDWDVPRGQRIFDALMVDDREYLWVLLSPDSAAERTTFDIFDPQGRYLGNVVAPYRVESRPPPVIRGDRIAFVTKDELEVGYVVTMRIQGRR